MSDEEARGDGSSGQGAAIEAYNRCVAHAWRTITADNSDDYPDALFRACMREEEELKKVWLDFFGDRLTKTHSPEEIEVLWRRARVEFRNDALKLAPDEAFADELPEEPHRPGSRSPIEPPREDLA